MAGLSDKERAGCAKMLNLMAERDLKSLFETVTNRKIEVESTQGTLQAIIAYSNDAAELLKRRKVQRDTIFKYLAKEGIAMPSNSDKSLLVNKTLEFWSSGKAKSGAYGGAGKAVPPRPRGAREEEVRSTLPSPRAPIPDQLGRESNHLPRPGPREKQITNQPERWLPKELCPQGADIQSTEIKAKLTVQQEGEQFCRWFFQLLNSQNPSLGQPPQDWGPHHFWTDAKLHLTSSAAVQQEEQLEGAELVQMRLLTLVRDEQLFLNPNLGPHGHRVVSTAHGLVLVAVAGTVHRDQFCLGLFEQVFGLICSPMENTWKIKFVDLKVRGPGSHDGPDGASPAATCDLVALQRQFT